MIPKPFVQDLLARVDIVSVIDACIPLKHSGANWVACCPFHNERHPSFTVSPSKQFYHCFGCGVHGDAIRFLMEHLGLNFVEAVRDLSQRVGLRVPEPEIAVPVADPSAVPVDDLLQAMERAAQFYKAQLRGSDTAVQYLKSRGVSGEIAGRFQLGYAPADWQALAGTFPHYEAKALSAAGLVIQNDQGRRYDRFRDRIIFPIHDMRGRIVGFGGRVLGDGEPKYLNSPETPLFEKGRELYGLFLARPAIREAARVVVVEGYMDVVALAQFGVGFAVATLGTSTTPMQVQKLLQQTDEIVFCFDGDAAGRKAAWRALENTLGTLRDGKQVKFLFLPAEHDPDSFVRANGAEAFVRQLKAAEPLSEVLMRELTSRSELGTLEGRARFVRDARELLVKVEAPVFGTMLRRRAAELAGVSPRELGAAPAPRAGARAPRRSEPQRLSIVRQLTEMLVFEPSLAPLADQELLGELSRIGLADILPAELELLRALVVLYHRDPSHRAMVEHFRGTPLEQAAERAEAQAIEWGNRGLADLGSEFEGGWNKLRERVRLARIEQLGAKLRGVGWSAEDRELYLRLQRPSPGKGHELPE